MKNRTTMFLCMVIAVAFVAAGLYVPLAGTHSQAMRASQSSGTLAVRASPLSQVTGTSPLVNGQAPLGQYTLLSENAQFNANAQLSVTVGFKAQPGLQQFVNEVSNPHSLLFRHYLTTAEVGSMFGLNPAAYKIVESYFSSYGLKVTPSSDYLSLQVSGSVAQMESAFHTKLGAYAMQLKSSGDWQPLFGNASGNPGSVETSPVFYVNTQGIDLPSAIARYVSGIVGLSGAMATPNIALPYGISPAGIYADPNNASSLASVNTAQMESASSYAVQNIQDGNFAWMPGYIAQLMGFPDQNYQLLFPSTMHVLTGATNLWNGLSTISSEPDQGQGVTVAVVEVGTLPLSWLQSFGQMVFNNSNQVTSRLSVIPINGANLFDGEIYGWTLETALDIEYIAAMAPMAHIDLVAVPNPDFSSFDMAYQYIAQFLTNGQSPMTSVTITSNSYGAGEIEEALFGSPMYLTVENTLLNALNAVGVTNFFASGDYSSAVYSGQANSAGMPAISTGSTSVGGGMATAYGPGQQEFPVTNQTVVLGYEFVFVPYPPYFLEVPLLGYVAPAQGLASFTYWAYGFGLGGTYSGDVGGGYGQSITETQPWWQNALDTYTTGAMIDPVISGSAAFNMTVWTGYWNFFYGGTSFATPISAGEWALIEEQANAAFGNPAMGNINPLLFASHNAYEAGVSSFHYDPFVPMMPMGTGYTWGPVNSFNWYYYNLSIEEPADPILPWWFNTLYNPAGSGWNYLQGLGMMNVGVLDSELVGQTPSTQHALLNQPFSVLMVTSSGLMPITTLTAGTTYTFQIVLANGQSGGYYNVVTYSDNPNNGMYGGGMLSMLQTNGNGQFTYTPMWNNATPAAAGSSYGYFMVTSVGSSDWSFQPFAVVQPMLTSGNLTLGVVNPYGQLASGSVEVTMFTTGQTGYYNLWGLGPAEVMLNGTPVADAVVTETSVNVSEFQFEDPTMPFSSYAPGVTLGTWLTDLRGNSVFWTDALLAELNGALYTQVVTLQASYRGLTSNLVTVFIEPQSGSFFPAVTLNSAGTALVGNIYFNEMKDVNYVNVSIGSMPGQYVNVTFPPVYYDSNSGIWMSGVTDGVIPINFTNLPPAGTPINLTLVAEGANDLSLSYSFFGFSFIIQDVQNPMFWTWYDPISNLGPAPTAVLSTGAPNIASGIVNLAYAGSWAAGKYSGQLTVSSADGTTVLATGLTTGTYALNTSAFMDGFYTVTYTVMTSTGLKASSALTFYFDNQQASLNALVAKLQNELTAAQTKIQTLQNELSSDTTTISTLQSQLSQLDATISSLQNELSTVNANYNATEAQLQQTKATVGSQQSTITSLEAQLSADSSTISTMTTQITSLKSQVAQLQGELNARKNFVAPAWYDVFGGMGAILLGIIAAAGLVVGLLVGMRSRKARKSGNSVTATNLLFAVPSQKTMTLYRKLR
jgi:subtilase family serine protease